VVWSVVAVALGNLVVMAGRHYGHDQWMTLVAIPALGGLAAWRLHRKGCPWPAIGFRTPRADKACVLWVLVAQAVVVAAACFALGLWGGGHDQRALRAVRTLFGTAFGEELIHRGVLVTVWANTGVRTRWVLLANMVAFGLWHAAGAVCKGVHVGEVAGPMFLFAPPLLYMRLRFGSIFAPMAFHAASNMPGVLQKPGSPCGWYFTPPATPAS
jgi:membrane protease YdiL (CAAX protease family)